MKIVTNEYHDLLSDLVVKRNKINDRDYPYRHIAIILKSNKQISTGSNGFRECFAGSNYLEHAEVSAVKHLPTHVTKKRKIKIDLLVIRISNSNKLVNSKPCYKCLDYIYNNLLKYSVRNIYYSNENGDLVVEKFNRLYHDDNKHVTKRFR
jgi:deoxycytidylate deaminase